MLQTDSLKSTSIPASKTAASTLQPKPKKQWKTHVSYKADSIAKADSVARFDSIARVDSIARLDSIHKSDSLKAIAEIPTGFQGTPHPPTLQSNSLVFGTLLILFLFLVVALSISISSIKENIKKFFKTEDHPSIFDRHTASDYYTRILLILFSVGVFSFFIYEIFSSPDNKFQIEKYGLFYGISFLFLMAKILIGNLVGYVFADKVSYKMAKESYLNVLSFLGICLFPLLLINIYSTYDVHPTIQILSLIFCSTACILVIIKLFQTFFHKTVASFYILLYLCTLEFLPLIALFQVYKLIV